MRGVLFDLDGTIVDSMPTWRGLDRKFIESKGHIFDVSISKNLMALSFKEAANYLRNFYGIQTDEGEMKDFMRRELVDCYSKRVFLKEGIMDLIVHLHDEGVKMAITTATEYDLCKYTIERFGLDKYMDFVLTPDLAGMHKGNPEFFEMALKRLGSEREKTLVFDDALYAIRLASSLNLVPIGIYDKDSETDREEIEKVSRLYIENYCKLDYQSLWK